MSDGPIFFLTDAGGKRTPIRIERAFSVADSSGADDALKGEWEHAGVAASVLTGQCAVDDTDVQTQSAIRVESIDINGVNRAPDLSKVATGTILKVASKESPSHFYVGVVETFSFYSGVYYFTFSEIFEAHGPVLPFGVPWLAVGERAIIEIYSFDEMMRTYLGGYSASHVPKTTSFNLRGIPTGTYALYLYSSQQDRTTLTGTDFYVQVNSATPVLKTVSGVPVIKFEENTNYSLFNLVLSAGDVVRVTVVGYLNGLQLKRV